MNSSNQSKFTSVFVALIVFVSIALHDTKIDAMTRIAYILPAAIVSFEVAQLAYLSHDMHTHVDKVSIKNTVKKFTGGSPKLHTRDEKDEKSKGQKSAPKGHHPFDNYHLPILA